MNEPKIKLRDGWTWEYHGNYKNPWLAVGPVGGDDPESNDYVALRDDGHIESNGQLLSDVVLAIIQANAPEVLREFVAGLAVPVPPDECPRGYSIEPFRCGSHRVEAYEIGAVFDGLDGMPHDREEALRHLHAHRKAVAADRYPELVARIAELERIITELERPDPVWDKIEALAHQVADTAPVEWTADDERQARADLVRPTQTRKFVDAKEIDRWRHAAEVSAQRIAELEREVKRLESCVENKDHALVRAVSVLAETERTDEPDGGTDRKDHSATGSTAPAPAMETAFDEFAEHKWRRLPVVVTARRMRAPFGVETREGLVHGRAGDWCVTGTFGESYPCADQIFRATHDFSDAPADPPVEWINGRATVSGCKLVEYRCGEEFGGFMCWMHAIEVTRGHRTILVKTIDKYSAVQAAIAVAQGWDDADGR